MSKSDEKDKNFIVESIEGKNCKEVNIYFYKDRTIEITDFTGKHNVEYINMEILHVINEKVKELGWNE